jgi:hypothetical protein
MQPRDHQDQHAAFLLPKPPQSIIPLICPLFIAAPTRAFTRSATIQPKQELITQTAGRPARIEPRAKMKCPVETQRYLVSLVWHRFEPISYVRRYTKKYEEGINRRTEPVEFDSPARAISARDIPG